MAILETGPIRAFFVLDISTAHLPESTLRAMHVGTFEPRPTWRCDWGYVFYVGDPESPEERAAALARYSCPGFCAAVERAWKLNLKFVCFDQDAEIYPDLGGLPLFEGNNSVSYTEWDNQ